MSIADNIAFLSRLPKMSDFVDAPTASPLTQVDDFGANAGHLSMWCYVPPDLPPSSPLVVVLHGCTQTAASFDHGSGWTAVAKRYGFAVLMPEQRRANNPNLCFNWFDPDKTARGRGEALSIYRMIATMVRVHRVSARCIYIVGLSAGGAMASALLAGYPEVFAGGAIIAGLPYGVADNVREALAAMASPRPHSAAELGDLVRGASSHQGPWPRMSVWHGTGDRTVSAANADQIVAQWRNIHKLPAEPMSVSEVDSQTRRVWWDADGRSIVEAYTIDDMGHGVPLGIAGAEEPYGATGPFMLEAGIGSTLRIAQFFELTKAQHAHPAPKAHVPPADPDPVERQKPKQAFDVGDVIARALTAAGLMK